MRAAEKRFYEFVASKPCLSCGGGPVEVAHIRAGISPKTGLPLPRRKGIASVIAVPLCASCHRHSKGSIHSVGEAAFDKALGNGEGYLVKYAVSLLAEFVLKSR